MEWRLLERLERALQFARWSISIFATLPSEEERRSFRNEKFISETGILLYVADMALPQSSSASATLRSIARDLEPYARSDRIVTMMRLRPAITSEVSVAHACLSKIGHPDAQFGRRMDVALSAPVSSMKERLPWKEIEALWFRTMIGAPSGIDGDIAIRKSTPSIGLDALMATRQEIYAFTHAVIYATDFASSSASFARPLSDIADDAECALARSLDEDDFDLAGELLMTWPCLRLDWSPLSLFALMVLTTVEGEVGFLPSLTLRLDAYNSTDCHDKKQYVMLEAYHTAYVMGLLASACLIAPHIPPSVVPHAGYGVCPQKARNLIASQGPLRRWEACFDKLPSSVQDSLVPFLITVGLRRAVMKKDLKKLHEISVFKPRPL